MELEQHHIVPKFLGGSNQPDNLVWICGNTHANVHELLRDMLKIGGVFQRPAGVPRYSYALAVEGFTRYQESLP